MCGTNAVEEVERGKREKKRVEIRKSGKIKHCHRVLSLSPRLVSAPHHGSGFLLPSLVIHWVHKLKDVRGTKLECGAWTQHRRLSNPLPVDERVCIRAVRRHRHHAVSVHEVAVVRQNSRTQQLDVSRAGTRAQVKLQHFPKLLKKCNQVHHKAAGNWQLPFNLKNEKLKNGNITAFRWLLKSMPTTKMLTIKRQRWIKITVRLQ